MHQLNTSAAIWFVAPGMAGNVNVNNVMVYALCNALCCSNIHYSVEGPSRPQQCTSQLLPGHLSAALHLDCALLHRTPHLHTLLAFLILLPLRRCHLLDFLYLGLLHIPPTDQVYPFYASSPCYQHMLCKSCQVAASRQQYTVHETVGLLLGLVELPMVVLLWYCLLRNHTRQPWVIFNDYTPGSNVWQYSALSTCR